MPLIESLEIEFFPTDAQGFFKKVIQQTIEAKKKSGQVDIVHYSSKVLILSCFYFSKSNMYIKYEKLSCATV